MEAPPLAKRGFVTLLATLVVTVFGMAFTFMVLNQSGWAAGTAGIVERSLHARNYAYACVEFALFQIVSGEVYETEGRWDFTSGECEFNIQLGENEHRIQSTGISEEAVRRSLVTVTTDTDVTESGTTTTILSTQWSENEQF